LDGAISQPRTAFLQLLQIVFKIRGLVGETGPFARSTNIDFTNQLPTLEVQPYTGGTTLHWRYNPTLVVPPNTGGAALRWWY